MRAGDADRGEYSAGTTVHRPVQPRPSHGPDPAQQCGPAGQLRAAQSVQQDISGVFQLSLQN